MIPGFTNLKDSVQVFTDGSNSLKSGFCGWSTIVRYQRLEVRRCGWAKGTNSFSELYAIVYALRRMPWNLPVVIYSDSQYAIRVLTDYRDKWVRNGFRNAKGEPVAYKELIQEGHKLLDGLPKLTLVHVPGHAGFEGNEAADKLAKAARFVGEGKLRKDDPTSILPYGCVWSWEYLRMQDGLDSDTGMVYRRSV